MKLQTKIILFAAILITIIVLIVRFVVFNELEKTIKTQMGNNVMDLAITIASIDIIKETLGTTKDYRIIQDTIENIRINTRTHYIIVMDMDGIKYSYPTEYGLGKKYISGGEEKVLQMGETYISEDHNELISAIRAFVPIYYNGDQVGAVLVGILNDTVLKELKPNYNILHFTTFLALLIGIIGALIFSSTIKRTIFGLEPKEIALLLGQRDLILHSFNNGILAIDQDGKILFFNKASEEILGLKEEDKGKNISESHNEFIKELKELLVNEQSHYDQEIKICKGKTLLCSHTLLRDHREEIIGFVFNFQDLTEAKQMAEELTGVKKLTSALRSQNHEFMNKLHIISGLLQLKEYDKAIGYISDISQQREEISRILNDKIRNAHISALLLAKYNKATECKISLEIDNDSNITKIPYTITVDGICSVIGNLIENAIDELVKYEGGKITVRLNSDDKDFKILVADNGPGINKKNIDNIFDPGFTTKDGNRGFGLSIVKEIIDSAGGRIKFYQNNGTVCEIYIPMGRRN